MKLIIESRESDFFFPMFARIEWRIACRLYTKRFHYPGFLSCVNGILTVTTFVVARNENDCGTAAASRCRLC